ncbi:hypothetical protein [Noviherbaspirillum pedocola]|uniref:Uncharacterized protein n=1 Tax=Noviherbaspirillum pedocola TaxID=2801341 RepID=A0A934SUI6_9BURK|nr:hypothetical protein [Noviherbaspirillum pedocola]MBK4733067.1 hypothetical protein [Noviherbaspirillum pedocola]
MPRLDILLPFSLPSPDHAADLMRALDLPSVALLAARGRVQSSSPRDAFARALPHEAWLAQRFGLARGLDAGGSPPAAPAAMAALGLADPGRWFLLQPAHLHVARDHLVLTDWRNLRIDGAESQALFAAAEAACAAQGHALRYGDERTWFLRADDWTGLKTSTMDAACGHNIDIWMPKGTGERAWRKLQNEIQMEWHMHAVNEARGGQPINTVWLWGGGLCGEDLPVSPYSATYGASGWTAYLDASAQPVNAEHVIADAPQYGLVIIDALSAPALAGDWSAWLAAWRDIESTLLAPLVAALREGRFDGINLLLADGERLLDIAASRASLRKFWIRPSLAALAPVPSAS